jgi:hypothetical protein
MEFPVDIEKSPEPITPAVELNNTPPDGPDDDEPLIKSKFPPFSIPNPAFMSIIPPSAAPAPPWIETEPPLRVDEVPALTITSPPSVAPSPTTRDMSPADPELEAPVEIRISPDKLPPDKPVLTESDPLSASDPASDEKISTFPLDDIVPTPLDMNIVPPVDDAELPPAKAKLAPGLNIEAPIFIRIFPGLPLDDSPVLRIKLPESLLESPLPILKSPDLPMRLASVLITIDPLEPTKPPRPLKREILPPFPCDEAPAVKSKPAPVDALTPFAIVISPALPRLESPVTTDNLPLFPKEVNPVEIVTVPELPFVASSDIIATSPDIDKPFPLLRTTFPPFPVEEKPASKIIFPPRDAPDEDPALMTTLPPKPSPDTLPNTDPAVISTPPAYAPMLLSPECISIEPPLPCTDVPTVTDILPDCSNALDPV